MRWPTPTEPVKLMAAMPGWLTSGVANHAAPAHHQVEHAGGHAAAADDLGQRPGAAGHQVGGLEHHAVAVGQRGRDLPGRNGDGEIPGRDEADHADRLAGDFDPDAGAHRGQGARPPGAGTSPAKNLKILPARATSPMPSAQRLALFARQQGAQLVLAGQDFVADLVQRIGARLDAAGRPGREGTCAAATAASSCAASAWAYSPITSARLDGLMLGA